MSTLDPKKALHAELLAKHPDKRLRTLSTELDGEEVEIVVSIPNQKTYNDVVALAQSGAEENANDTCIGDCVVHPALQDVRKLCEDFVAFKDKLVREILGLAGATLVFKSGKLIK